MSSHHQDSFSSRENSTGAGYERLASNDSLISVLHSNRRIVFNFLIMSLLLSVNHGVLVSCLALATATLERVGAWQSGLLHVVFAVSSLLFGNKKTSPKYCLVQGMMGYSVYVACFWAQQQQQNKHGNATTTITVLLAVVGAVCGGMGGALVWIGQGCYLKRAAKDYDACTVVQEHDSSFLEQDDEPPDNRTATVSWLSGMFAFIYLLLEVGAKLSCWFILQFHPRHSSQEESAHWNAVFMLYTVLAVGSTLAICFIKDYPSHGSHSVVDNRTNKMSAAWHLLMDDTKMKYMVATCAVFGFATALVNAHVNGIVVPLVLHSKKWVGLFSALTSAVGAIASLLFAAMHMSEKSKTPPQSSTIRFAILMIGFVAFGLTALPLLLYPHGKKIGIHWLVTIYSLQGMGRATYEGPLRAVFCQLFQCEQAAFANMTLHTGVFMALGFVFSFVIPCRRRNSGAYCVDEYKDKNHHGHDILTLEVLVVVSAVLAILGYWRASVLHHRNELQTLTTLQTQENVQAENGDDDDTQRLL